MNERCSKHCTTRRLGNFLHLHARDVEKKSHFELSEQAHPTEQAIPFQSCSGRSARRRLELAADGISATATIEHDGGGATAAPVALTRHREAQRAREVALLAVLRAQRACRP